ncbi:MAG: nucleoside recognition domain-containing protein, partial [Clostridium celatum]|nr:nucleoside recognition domain-containing protein [Clostridium celatum]
MEISGLKPVDNKKVTLKDNLKFILPSILGVILFMIPVKHNGDITIPIAIFSSMLVDFLGDYLVYIITGTLALSAVISLITTLLKPKFIVNNKFLNSLFSTTPLWLTARVLGGIFGVLAAFQIGPEMIISGDTGAFVLHDLLTVLFSIFLFAGLFLPLLLNFGLLEFFGALLTKVMRPVFKLPGRSSIDCITSWLGDGTLGIMLTNKQYE